MRPGGESTGTVEALKVGSIGRFVPVVRSSAHRRFAHVEGGSPDSSAFMGSNPLSWRQLKKGERIREYSPARRVSVDSLECRSGGSRSAIVIKRFPRSEDGPRSHRFRLGRAVLAVGQHWNHTHGRAKRFDTKSFTSINRRIISLLPPSLSG